jgi:hypothetical protein
MPDRPNVIPVPKPKASSYNPDRPLIKNTLLLNQVKHFLQVEKKLPLEQQTGTKLEDLRTEAEASEYVAKLTAILHPQAMRAR